MGARYKHPGIYLKLVVGHPSVEMAGIVLGQLEPPGIHEADYAASRLMPEVLASCPRVDCGVYMARWDSPPGL